MNLLKKSKKIEFQVKGKPPKKADKSLWSENNKQVDLVLNLRQKAHDEIIKSKLDYFHGPVKLTLKVFHPNTLEIENTDDYLGDLDTLVAGVFESLQPSPNDKENQFKIDPKLKEKMEILHNDAQISTIVASKIKIEENKDPFYTVKIELD